MRPSFEVICQKFSLPDSKLLQLQDRDKTSNDNIHKLGANLEFANELYMDIQNRYQTEQK